MNKDDRRNLLMLALGFVALGLIGGLVAGDAGSLAAGLAVGAYVAFEAVRKPDR